MGKRIKPSGSNKTSALSFDQVNYIVRRLEEKKDIRTAIICLIMFQCVRINDVLQSITLKDVYKENGEVRDEIHFTEMKTKKQKAVVCPQGSNLHRLLTEYRAEIGKIRARGGVVKLDSVLFYNTKMCTPLRDSGVKEILRLFVGQWGIEQCSPHSFRKAGAKYLHVEKGVSIEIIREILNHSSSKITLRYLDIKSVEVRKSMKDLAF